MTPLKDTYKILRDYTLVGKLQLLLLLLFVSTLTLNTKLNSILLGLYLISSLFTFSLEAFNRNKHYILLFTGSFLLSLIALTYSNNVQEGKLVLERQLALFLLPLVLLSSFQVTHTVFKLVIKVFFISMVCVSAYLLKCSADNFMQSPLGIKNWFVKDNLYHAFAAPIKMHATYLSLYVAMAIMIGFNEFISNTTWWLKLLFFMGTLVLVTTITLLSSRVVISSLLFIIVFVYPFFTWKRKHKFFLLVAGVAVFFTFFFLVSESSFIKNRFVEKMDDEIKMTSFLKADSTYNPVYGGETRADRWFCALELIREKPVIGYGTGSEKEELMKKYQKYNLQNAEVNNYDAHNQYLAYAIKGGLIALVIFVMAVLYAISLALKHKSFIYLSFILLFAVTCLTEDVLESNKGIFFFAFFNTFYACYVLVTRREKMSQRN